MQRKIADIDECRSHYAGFEKPCPIAGHSVILVAIPLAPGHILHELSAKCYGIGCLVAPEAFYSVAAYYLRFEPNSDAQVAECLADGRCRARRRKMSQDAEGR